jgi:trehalose utilization protein
MSNVLRVLVWDENPPHAPKELYPNSINGAIAEGLKKHGNGRLLVRLRNQDEPWQGVSDDVLAETDVLIWWAHARHSKIDDETARRVVKRVHEDGMGFVALHSAHYSKTFCGVLGCTGDLKGGWRVTEPAEREEIRVCAPWHPIAEGVTDFKLEHEEMYGAPFDVPPPLVQVFQSHFPLDGKTFPSGLCWTVGRGINADFKSGPGKGKGEGIGIGRVFYFRPGHETLPTYFNENVQRVISNAVLWCGKVTG